MVAVVCALFRVVWFRVFVLYRLRSVSLLFGLFVFFFKQKTAYEMLRSLVGSEMCIRDSRRSTAVVLGSRVMLGQLRNASTSFS